MKYTRVGNLITFRGKDGQNERYVVHRYLRAQRLLVLRSRVTNALTVISLHSLARQIVCGTAFVSFGGLSVEADSAYQRGATPTERQNVEGGNPFDGSGATNSRQEGEDQ